MLWPRYAPAQPNKALNTELWRLRKALEAGGLDAGVLIKSEANCLSLFPDAPIRVDLFEFNAAVDAALAGGRDAQNAGLRAARLYRGELLSGFYDEWCLAPREACRERFFEVTEMLMESFVAQRAWREAIHTGRRLLAQDPLLEHVHREIMRSYLHLGDQAAARRQYEHLVERLRRELGVAPSDETTALNETIPARPGPPFTAHRILSHEADLIARIEMVAAALKEADKTLEQLREAVLRVAH